MRWPSHLGASSSARSADGEKHQNRTPQLAFYLVGDRVAVFHWLLTAPILVRRLGVFGMALLPRNAFRRTGAATALERYRAPIRVPPPNKGKHFLQQRHYLQAKETSSCK